MNPANVVRAETPSRRASSSSGLAISVRRRGGAWLPAALAGSWKRPDQIVEPLLRGEATHGRDQLLGRPIFQSSRMRLSPRGPGTWRHRRRWDEPDLVKGQLELECYVLAHPSAYRDDDARFHGPPPFQAVYEGGLWRGRAARAHDLGAVKTSSPGTSEHDFAATPAGTVSQSCMWMRSGSPKLWAICPIFFSKNSLNNRTQVWKVGADISTGTRWIWSEPERSYAGNLENRGSPDDLVPFRGELLRQPLHVRFY